MRQKGFGQIIIFLFLGLIILVSAFYFYNTRQQKLAPSVYPTPSPQVSPIPSNDKEALSLDTPQNYPQISWQTKKVTIPEYLDFKDSSGKKYRGQVPLTGNIIEGKIQNTPANNKLVEDYYVSKLQEQGWVKKVLHANGYELGVMVRTGPGSPGSIYCKSRELYVYIGYKADNLRLIKISSSIDPAPPCYPDGPMMEERTTPTPTPAVTDIKYQIFISDPLPFNVIRAEEIKVN